MGLIIHTILCLSDDKTEKHLKLYSVKQFHKCETFCVVINKFFISTLNYECRITQS